MLEGLAALACERLKRPRVRVVGGRSVLGRCRFGGPLSIEVLPDPTGPFMPERGILGKRCGGRTLFRSFARGECADLS
jgi:hypothetical protein